jgi:alpha-L-fucosidase
VFIAAGSAGLVLLAALADISVDAPRCASAPSGPYQPTEASLDAHPVPAWFADAKFGVFIHWGLFSIPGFAPKGDFVDVLETQYDRALLVHPYAEDYWNAIKDPATPSAAFHREHYKSMPYEGFKPLFMRSLARWDPAAWAETFHAAGARYVVLVAKYHDGFCLWPSAVRNPHQPDWFSQRDIVGELAAAVRALGMRFGVYYSGGVDWTFRRRISRTLGDYVNSTPGGDYPAYADAQVRELIARYRPDILWNDISWPTDRDSLFRLFACYYNTVPDGVVNDRWSEATAAGIVMRTWPARFLFDLVVKQALRQKPDILQDLKPPPVPHSDYTTPEYTQYRDVQPKVWEMTRGMGHSFGYNRNEHDADYASFETLVGEFVDAVAKNGNLLLNVGPRGDAQVPPEQASRLDAFGRWLAANGDAIYGTRPWSRTEATTANGEAVRFTAKGDIVNAIVLGRPRGERITIRNLRLSGTGHIVGAATGVRVASEGADTVLTFEPPLAGEYSPAVAIRRPLP